MENLAKVLGVIGPLPGALIGGGFGLLGAWLADRSELRNEESAI